MNERPTICVAGLGSPHGDDRFGWLAADRVGALGLPHVAVRRLRSAADLIGDFANFQKLVVCDACLAAGPVGELRRWTWPDAELAPLAFSGGHDLGLAAALALAGQLGKLPRQTSIWGLTVRPPARDGSELAGPLSAMASGALDPFVDALARELCHA